MLSGSLLSSLPSCRPPRHAGHALHARLPWLSWHSRSTSRHAPMQRVVLGHALDALLGDSVVAVALRQVRAEHHLHAAPLRMRAQLPLSRHLHGGALSEWISFTDGAMTYRSSLVMDPKPPSLHGSHNRILGEWHNQQQLTKLGFHCWHTHMPREYP